MEEKKQIQNLVITLGIIISVLLVFYFITVFITKKQNKGSQNNDIDEVVIDYDTILVSDIYHQNQSSYYVLVSMPEDKNITSYKNSLISYSNGTESLKVYEVDLGSAFNKKYISDITDFTDGLPKFSETTLLKIENKKIIEHYQGNNITVYLQTLSK